LSTPTEELPPSSSGFQPLNSSEPHAPGSVSAPTSTRASEFTAARRIAVFFIFLILTIFGFHHLIQFGMRRIETGSYGVTNRIVSGQINAEIIITGSSRALTHYDSRIIQNVTGRSTFNIGVNGSQTDMQLAVLETYLQHNVPPKLVIHNLDSFTFVTTKEIYDPAQYLPYLDQAPIYEAVAKITPHAWKWRWFPLYGYAVEDMRFTWTLGLRRVMGIHPPETQFNGFQPRDTAWTGDFEEFRRNHPRGVQFPIEAQGVRDLQGIAETCRDAGVPLLLVYSPVYAEMQALESNRAEIFRQFAGISEQYELEFWDFSLSEVAKSKINFYNSQHLNRNGAHAFSTELAARLVKR
jgi:hypothetical protein